jgi:hypothetical protein
MYELLLSTGRVCLGLQYRDVDRLCQTSDSSINPFQSNFSDNRTLPSSYLFWVVKRLVDYLNYPTVLKEENMEKENEYNLRYLMAKVCTT